MANIEVTGNLGSDPELTFTPNGKAKLEFSVGDTPRRLNQQTNKWEDAGETTWWRVTEWEQKAEFWAEHLNKGTKVIVVGQGGVRTYEKKDGTKGFSAEIKPKTIALIPRNDSAVSRGNSPQQGHYGGVRAGNGNNLPNGGWGNEPAPTDPPF